MRNHYWFPNLCVQVSVRRARLTYELPWKDFSVNLLKILVKSKKVVHLCTTWVYTAKRITDCSHCDDNGWTEFEIHVICICRVCVCGWTSGEQQRQHSGIHSEHFQFPAIWTLFSSGSRGALFRCEHSTKYDSTCCQDCVPELSCQKSGEQNGKESFTVSFCVAHTHTHMEHRHAIVYDM